jgi:uncharacterized repeat protein (TIGR01451 family)
MLHLCSAGLCDGFTNSVYQEKIRANQQPVIGADWCHASSVVPDAETALVLAQENPSFLIQYGGITMNNTLRSIQYVLIVAALLLVTVVPTPAHPSAHARPDVGSDAVSADSRLVYQAASEDLTNQIIIKYKATADISGAKAPAHPDRIGTLSAVAGVQLEYFREMSGGAHVLRLPNKLAVSEVSLIAEKLMTLGDVEYAEPDRILQHTLTPNDSQYTNQWHYYDTWGINAPGAWDITTGSSDVVVAVIDTGITNHADLAGRTLPGYDFISDVFTANDGNGRDSDPSDPGDWYNVGECSNDPYGSSSSSWHGTHVAGTIGAATNNGVGVAGINWVSKILPVRVLGKCGGYTSDIIDGMRWAAGLSVSGVPANSNPARVLNISLGGPGACSTSQQSAINEITAAGSVVVVAAGNSNTDASNFNPASCNNVVAVAATNRSGYRAYYSNYGSVVKISAPGGETNSTTSNGVLSTLNTGTTVPVADTYAYYQGTSMATPHVVGVASLVLSVKPSLTPAQVLQVLQDTARDFPTGGTCTTSNCGAGIVDAAAAVGAVNKPDVSIVKQVIGSNFAPGDRITFTLSISNVGAVVASSVVVTDVLPPQVLTPTYDSSLPITRTGVYTYVWNVGTLDVGQSGVITIYGQIDPSLTSGWSFSNIAYISDPADTTLDNKSSRVTVGGGKVYLPVVMQNWPPIVSHTYYASTDDTVLESAGGNTWYGSYSDFAVGYCTISPYNIGVARSILRFDLSSIPAGAYIKSATLQPYLIGYVYQTGQSSNMVVTAYRISQAWPGSPTWNNFANAYAESYGSTTVGTSFVRSNIDVTVLVQGWVNGTWPNYGMMLRGQEGSYCNLKDFASADSSSSYWPQLLVEYADPTAIGSTVTVAIPAERLRNTSSTRLLDGSGSGGGLEYRFVK